MQCSWSYCEIDSREQSVYLQRLNKIYHKRKQLCKVSCSKRIYKNNKWNTMFKNMLLIFKILYAVY